MQLISKSVYRNALTRQLISIRVIGMVLGLALMTSFAQPVAAKYTAIAMGIDTIAGQSTLLKAKNFDIDQAVNFSVTKPDGTVITLASKTGSAGEAQAVLADYHTKKAGVYGLKAVSQDLSVKSLATSFEVFPADLDPNNSTIATDRSLVKADGEDSTNVKVVFRDKYDNYLVGQTAKLISSRKTDVISPSSVVTNSFGEATFKVSSSNSGLANFTALDLGSDQIILERASVSFVDQDMYLSDAGGDLIMTAYAADVGPLAGFEITDLPATVKANENISFKVKAVDADGQIIQDYTGTIRFSAEGDNSSGVTLPANYKFLAEDLGQHQFNLGLSFAENGTYKIVVNDAADKFKKGEATVVVGSGSTSSTTGTGSKPVITSPAAGTYSQSQQTITGTAKSSSTVKFYDNSQEIGSTPIGPNGKFSFQTPALSEGKHVLYVVNLDSISLEVVGTSDQVEINIDTTPPALEELKLDPAKDIKAGSVINVKVFSEKNLSQVALIFNFDIVDLNASIDDPSVYVGTIQAPADAGVYKLSVLLVDELQNEKTYEDQATITVDPNGGTVETVGDPPITTPDTTPVEETPVTDNGGQTLPVVGAPSQVTGLIAYGSDHRVTLVWDAANDDKLVKSYKIYYGDDVKDLKQNVVTKDASTTWYVPNLENGKEYFFAITALDDENNESVSRSEIVSSIPFVLEIKNGLSEAPTQPLDNGYHPAAYNGPFPENTSKTGPEVLLLLGASTSVTAVWKMGRKKK